MDANRLPRGGVVKGRFFTRSNTNKNYRRKNTMEKVKTYSSKIVATSHELTPKEKLRCKDTAAAIRIDAATEKADLVIAPTGYAVIEIHNEKSKDHKDYNNYLIFGNDGATYVTGSDSFWRSFKDIYDVMQDSKEPWEVVCTRRMSKNYAGKFFLTCYAK